MLAIVISVIGAKLALQSLLLFAISIPYTLHHQSQKGCREA
jgi:hypothetical protein